MTVVRLLIATLALAGTSVAAQAPIKIEVATVHNGVTYIKGNGAQPGAQIFWEGTAVTTANRNNGGFSFYGVLPADCIGTLGDGRAPIDVYVLGCSAQPPGTSVVFATGQTDCYDAVPVRGTSGHTFQLTSCPGNLPGQDGALRIGVTRSYTHGETVLDDVTGLEWERLCSASLDPGCDPLHEVSSVYRWVAAFGKIDQLNAVAYGGHTDWRLPNLNELLTLVEFGRAPAFHPGFSVNDNNLTSPEWYWSSTTPPTNISSVWAVNFYLDGKADTKPRAEPYVFVGAVRAVRGGR